MDNKVVKRWMTPIASAISVILMSSSAHAIMKPLDDQALSQETGQAAFYTSYVAPTGTTTSDYGFFTLGLNGTVALNANINHLQLGCGGVNGPGCDIDINQLGLSGLNDTTDPTNGSPTFTAQARPSTDAVLTNPFIQLAIANPTSLSTRSLVGFNLGAQSIIGLLTAGSGNSSTYNGLTNQPTGVGINTLSGYMQIAAASGTAMTAAELISYDGSTTPKPGTGDPIAQGQATTAINTAITGNVSSAGATSCGGFLSCVSFTSKTYYIMLAAAQASINTDATTLNGSRLNNIMLSGSGIAPSINMYGNMTATALGILNLSENIANDGGTNLTNLGLGVTVNEGLSYIHDIPLNGNGASLSLQSVKLLWPGSAAADIAQPGWWLSVGGTVNVGNISPALPVQLTPAVISQALGIVSTSLTNTPIQCGDAGLLSCFGGNLPDFTIPLAGSSVSVPLNNLVLGAQNPPSNCYGSLKFCFLFPILLLKRKQFRTRSKNV